MRENIRSPTYIISKEENQIKVVKTNSNKIEDILFEFPTQIEYEDETGFKSTLLIDTVTTTEICVKLI